MTKDHTKTVLIRKPDKVAPDERGRSVWLGKVEAVELELVSTTALQKILKSEGGEARIEIQKLAVRAQGWGPRARHRDRSLPHRQRGGPQESPGG